MDAFAWTESSWRSTAVGCDKEIGVMQILPGNVPFLQQRFGETWDVNTLTDNTQMGAAYIEWLTVYFGTVYFGSVDLMHATAPVGAGGAPMALLDVVIAAYNAGYGACEDLNGTPTDGSDDFLFIPNPSYVAKVKSNYDAQPWAV
jgi:soluble lytic murein transglycosylase-like protein